MSVSPAKYRRIIG